MKVLVTVGSTEFRPLTDFCSTEQFRQFINAIGASELLIQHGSAPAPDMTTVSSVHYRVFDYDNDLAAMINQSDLVIGHAGAGIILEASRSPGTKVHFIVVNDALMGNHQLELATSVPEISPLPLCKAFETCEAYIEAVQDEDLLSQVRMALLVNRHVEAPATQDREEVGSSIQDVIDGHGRPGVLARIFG